MPELSTPEAGSGAQIGSASGPDAPTFQPPDGPIRASVELPGSGRPRRDPAEEYHATKPGAHRSGCYQPVRRPAGITHDAVSTVRFGCGNERT